MSKDACSPVTSGSHDGARSDRIGSGAPILVAATLAARRTSGTRKTQPAPAGADAEDAAQPDDWSRRSWCCAADGSFVMGTAYGMPPSRGAVP